SASDQESRRSSFANLLVERSLRASNTYGFAATRAGPPTRAGRARRALPTRPPLRSAARATHSPDAWRARLEPPSSPDAPSRDRPSRGEPRSPNRASPSPRPRRACVRGAGRGRARIRPPEHWRRDAGTHVAGSGGAHGARRDSRRFVAGGVERAAVQLTRAVHPHSPGVRRCDVADV